ncbi:transposase [Paenibacillus sp. LHD-38]|uniref:transposase n=1 Tax=Paenibacillus sp. LHD-38 TaxID=3072143 RepID=UPI0035BE9A0C
MRVLAEESTASETARELGVHYTTVMDWVKLYKQDCEQSFPGSGNIRWSLLLN